MIMIEVAAASEFMGRANKNSILFAFLPPFDVIKAFYLFLCIINKEETRIDLTVLNPPKNGTNKKKEAKALFPI